MGYDYEDSSGNDDTYNSDVTDADIYNNDSNNSDVADADDYNVSGNEYDTATISNYGGEIIVTSNLNIREQPNTDCEVYDMYECGSVVSYYNYYDGWYEIPYGNGVAYLSGDYVREVTMDQLSSGSIGVIHATTDVNIRSGPGTSYERLGGLGNQQKAVYVGYSSGWYEIIIHEGQHAYVSGDYVAEDNFTDYTSTSVNNESLGYAYRFFDPNNVGVTYDYGSPLQDGMMMTTETVNVYDAPKNPANDIGTLGAGGFNNFYGYDNGWFAIPWVYGEVGYVPDIGAIKVSGYDEAEEKYTILTTIEETIVYAGPSTDYAIQGSIEQATVLVALSKNEGWYEIFYMGSGGSYVSANSVGIGYANEVTYN